MKAVAALATLLAAPAGLDPPSWTTPIAPFHVVGPIWYVGTRGLSAYLIRTRSGAILLDATMSANVPAIKRNIVRVGVPLRQVRWLLNSHAHFDHAEGLAAIKRDTGAHVAALGEERPALESGRPPSEISYGVVAFPPVHVDRVLRDGDVVRLGGVALTATRTAGHTPGCTTWSTRVIERGRPLNVVFPCSLTVAGNRLIGNRGYGGIVGDFRASFARLRAMRADVVLTAHPEIAGIMERHARARGGDAGAFVDRALLSRVVDDAEHDFERELARERAGRP